MSWYWYCDSLLMEFLVALYLFPQVVKLVRVKPEEPEDRLPLPFLFGALIIRRFWVPIYYRAYHSNIFGYQPNYQFVWIWSGMFAVQVLALGVFNWRKVQQPEGLLEPGAPAPHHPLISI